MVPFWYHLPVRSSLLRVETYIITGPKSTFDVIHDSELQRDMEKFKMNPVLWICFLMLAILLVSLRLIAI